MGDALSSLVSGLLVMGYFIAGLFFLRFWHETRDRLFGIFAGAFCLLGVQRFLLVLLEHPRLELCAGLRQMLVGGESFSGTGLTRFLERLPGTRLHHLYGDDRVLHPMIRAGANVVIAARRQLRRCAGQTVHGPNRQRPEEQSVNTSAQCDVIRQYLQAGLIDSIHLVQSHALLGRGEHLLQGLDLPALGFKVQEAWSGRSALATITGAALADDMQKGIIDRFRSLPIWHPSVLVGALRLLGSPAGRRAVAAFWPPRPGRRGRGGR